MLIGVDKLKKICFKNIIHSHIKRVGTYNSEQL